MRRKNILKLGIFFIFVILFSISFFSAYTQSSIQYTSPGVLPSGFSSSGGQWIPDRTMCEAGQDFALQIDPFGCEPAVVRSDLLEEQNVPVFCKISATKMNPLIGVQVIDYITFTGKELPKSVSGVGFYPAQSALGVQNKLNSPLLNNIGYAVIVLKKEPNASAVPEMVSGNLTAFLRYNIKDAFGIGDTRFYLPEISDDKVWENSMKSYGFWKGKGYLRADSVTSEGAKISIYSGTQKLKTLSLDKGETSSEIYLPGFDCFVGVKLQLESLDSPDTRAILSVNGDNLQLNKGEKFLDNKCTLLNLEKRGLTKKAEISCKADEGTERFELVLTPKISITINGDKKEVSAGDFLYEGVQKEKPIGGGAEVDRKVYVYLAYIGTKGDSGKIDDLYITLLSTPVNSGLRLGDSDIAKYASKSEGRYSEIYRDKSLIVGGMAIIGGKIRDAFNTLADRISKDKELKYIPYKYDEVFNTGLFGNEVTSNNFAGKEVKVIDFASPVNSALGSGTTSNVALGTSTSTSSTAKVWTVDEMYGLLNLPNEYLNEETVNVEQSDGTFKSVITSKEDKIKVIKDSLQFLLNEFGQPLVTKRMDLTITADPIKNSMMSWSSTSPTRKVLVDGFGMYRDPAGKATLVHELFHAFYQTDSFLQSGKDLTIEGSAVYAEYKYRYGTDFNTKLEENLVVLSANKPVPFEPTKKFNYADIPGTRYMYVYAGNQFKDKSSSEIRSILTQGQETFDFVSTGGSKVNYDRASQDYSKIITSFAGEKDPLSTSEIILGEESFIQHVILASILQQKGDIERLCKEFSKAYPNSKRYSEIESKCKDLSKLSSATSSSKEVAINANQKIISLEDIREPSFEEYGVRLRITFPDKKVQDLDLIKDKTNYFAEGQYVQLLSIDKDTISMNVNRTRVGAVDQYLRPLYETNRETLKKGTPNSFGTAYTFEIVDIYEKKNARVSVLPIVNRAQTEANFSFYIGVEKRSIELSPEKTKQKINDLNKTISDWKDKSQKLGKVVEGMKGACLATGLALTMRNFINNVGGQSIARQEVMMGEGGWNKKCADAVSSHKLDGKEVTYKTVEQCFIAQANEIDKQVTSLYQIIQKQDSEIKPLQESCKIKGQGVFFEQVIDTECLKKAYSPGIKSELKTSLENYKVEGKNVNIVEVLSLVENNKVSIEDMRKLQLYARAKDSGLSDLSKKELDKLLGDIWSSNQQEIATQTYASDLGISAEKIPYVSFDKDAKTLPYSGLKYKDVMGKYNLCPETVEEVSINLNCKVAVSENEPVAYFTTNDRKLYLGILEQQGTKLVIKTLYDTAKGEVVKDSPILSKINFEIMNEESYQGNTYKSSIGSSIPGPIMRCYETEPYKGYPAVIPVDTKNGWYASISQNLPAFGSVGSYQASGRVTSFYLCNVWKNGIEENRGGDDKCTMVNLGTGQSLTQIAGLTSSQASKLVDDAIKVVEAGQKKCQGGSTTETFNLGANAKGVKMGAPAANIPDMQCYNFMSPNDCKLLFNVCDPVVCPSSRCDFGGKYPVRDVIQSGIVGSVLLCLPNFVGTGGDVYIPVCLSGIKAGIDSLLSVFESYRDCLQENLATGRMTGVCDEIYSVHLCEFFWRQTLPLAKMIIPKTIELMMGKSVRGGGEYSSVQNAWTTAGQSMDYFAQYYAAEAYASFKARITQGVTDAVCKTYISGAYPDGGKIIDSLTKPTSPPQFTGRFDEIPFTSATNPPISQYKVFYHIYAGNDSRVYYQVYLTDVAESSYYKDTATKLVVATGYIEQGGKKTETKDFTAVAGYKKMCIIINGREPECGFKQVSTSFAMDYMADQYVKEQANEMGITSESTCVSGTPSAWSLASVNLEGAADELVNPKLYNRGIIRICANENPGLTTDKDATNPRWISVGYCGKQELKCWLDKESVKSSVNFNSSTDFLANATKNFLEQITKEGKYLDDAKFSTAVKEMSSKEPATIIGLINSILDKVLMNSQKGKLYLIRADAYGKLANAEFKKEQTEIKAKAETIIEEKKKAEDKNVYPVGKICEPNNDTIKKCFVEINKKNGFILDATYSNAPVTKDFVDNLQKNGVITSEEYNDIKGFTNRATLGIITIPDKINIGGFSIPLPGGEKNMDYVFNLLENKYNAICADLKKKAETTPAVIGECSPEKFTALLTTLKSTSVGGRKCLCGDNCGAYANEIIAVSGLLNVDKLLFLSLMMQESSCDSSVSSDSSTGLMQVNLDVHCGKYELSSDKVKCKEELINNSQKNIDVGAQILKSIYTTYGSKQTQFKSACTKEYQSKIYTGWDAALRGYNGWGCNSKYPSQDNFVEEINARYVGLQKMCGGGSATGTALEGVSSCSDLAKEKLYLEAIAKGEKLNLTSTYSQNANNWNFVDDIYKNKLITEEDYNALSGKRYFGLDIEKDMRNVLDVLRSRYEQLCGAPFATLQYIDSEKSFRLGVKDNYCKSVNYTLYYGDFGIYLTQQDFTGKPLEGIISSKTGQMFIGSIPLSWFPGSALSRTNYYVEVQCYNSTAKKAFETILKSTIFQASGTEKIVSTLPSEQGTIDLSSKVTRLFNSSSSGQVNPIFDKLFSPLDPQEKNNILNAKLCGDCGGGALNICDENECTLIGAKISKNCIFGKGYFVGGDCVEIKYCTDCESKLDGPVVKNCNELTCFNIGKNANGVTCVYDEERPWTDNKGGVVGLITPQVGSKCYPATKCGDCGDGIANYCDKVECAQINKGLKNDACIFYGEDLKRGECYSAQTCKRCFDIFGSKCDKVTCAEISRKMAGTTKCGFDSSQNQKCFEISMASTEDFGFAITRMREFITKYGEGTKYKEKSDAKEYIDSLVKLKILTSDEYNEITGGSSLNPFNWQSNLKEVLDLLNKKYQTIVKYAV